MKNKIQEELLKIQQQVFDELVDELSDRLAKINLNIIRLIKSEKYELAQKDKDLKDNIINDAVSTLTLINPEINAEELKESIIRGDQAMMDKLHIDFKID